MYLHLIFMPDLHMFVQVTLNITSIAAVYASVRFLAGVYSHVVCEPMFSAQHLPTDVTSDLKDSL